MLPAAFDAVTVQVSARPLSAAVTRYVAPVAPATIPPSRRHWYAYPVGLPDHDPVEHASI